MPSLYISLLNYFHVCYYNLYFSLHYLNMHISLYLSIYASHYTPQKMCIILQLSPLHIITFVQLCISLCHFIYVFYYTPPFIYATALAKPKHLSKPPLYAILYTSLILCWFLSVWFFWYSLKIWISIWGLIALLFLNMPISWRIDHILEDVPFKLYYFPFPFLLKLFKKKQLMHSLIMFSNISHYTL